MTPTIRVYREPEALTRAAASFVRHSVNAAVEARGRASLALSGGSTPRPLYELLGGSTDASLRPWSSVDFFWSDERWVAPTSADSNFRLAAETWLRPARVGEGRIHPVRTDERTPGAAAEAYDRALHAQFGSGVVTFDLALLGVGEDGHTASLFPGSESLGETERWAVSVPPAPQPPHVPRITLTLPALNASRIVVVLASGPQKATVVARCLRAGGREPSVLPAERVAGQAQTVWLLDHEAASKLPPQRPDSTRRRPSD